MNDDELRALVRQAIQKHLGAAAEPIRTPAEAGLIPTPVEAGFSRPGTVRTISFAQYSLERAPDDTMCLIEPAVRCNHCGFCKCHGH